MIADPTAEQRCPRTFRFTSVTRSSQHQGAILHAGLGRALSGGLSDRRRIPAASRPNGRGGAAPPDPAVLRALTRRLARRAMIGSCRLPRPRHPSGYPRSPTRRSTLLKVRNTDHKIRVWCSHWPCSQNSGLSPINRRRAFWHARRSELRQTEFDSAGPVSVCAPPPLPRRTSVWGALTRFRLREASCGRRVVREGFQNLGSGSQAAGSRLWEHRRMLLSFAYLVFSALLRLLVGRPAQRRSPRTSNCSFCGISLLCCVGSSHARQFGRPIVPCSRRSLGSSPRHGGKG